MHLKFHFHSIIDLKKVYGSPELQGTGHDTARRWKWRFGGQKTFHIFVNSDDPGQSGEYGNEGEFFSHQRTGSARACRSMQAWSDDLLLCVVRELVGFYFPGHPIEGYQDTVLQQAGWMRDEYQLHNQN